MAESYRDSLDALPNLVILEIMRKFDGLAEKSIMAQVSHRYNSLAKLKICRKNIFISKEELQSLSRNEETRSWCLKTILKEINQSRFFETLTIDIPHEYDGNDYFKLLLKEIQKNLGKLEKFVWNCMLHTSTNHTHFKFLFSPKYKNVDAGLSHPSNTPSLNFSGKDTRILEKIVNSCKESLLEFRYEGKITLPLLRLLANCENLRNVILIGQLTLEDDVNETDLPKIRSKAIFLSHLPISEITSEIPQKVRDIFFSDALLKLEISFHLLRGVESEICSKCPNLRYFNYIRNFSHLLREIDLDHNFISQLNTHHIQNIYSLLVMENSLKTVLIDSMNKYVNVNDTIYNRFYIFRVVFFYKPGNVLPLMVLSPGYYGTIYRDDLCSYM